jgi:hypothetical protein
MSEDNDRLLQNLHLASSTLRKVVSGKAGEGAEKTYGQAYMQCVRAGLKPQLKKKYR